MKRYRWVVVITAFFAIYLLPSIDAQSSDDVWPMSRHDIFRTGRNGFGINPIGAKPTGFQAVAATGFFFGSMGLLAPPLIGLDGNVILVHGTQNVTVSSYPPPFAKTSSDWQSSPNWQYTLCDNNCEVNGSPLVSLYGVVIVQTANSMVAINADGHLVWQIAFGSSTTDPLVTFVEKLQANVIYNTDQTGTLWAILLLNGTAVWSQSASNTLYSTPTMGVDDAVIVSSSGGTVYAFDPATGEQLWNYPLGSGLSTASIDVGMYYRRRAISSGNETSKENRQSMPIDDARGRIIFTNSSAIFTLNKYGLDANIYGTSIQINSKLSIAVDTDPTRRQIVLVCGPNANQLCALSLDDKAELHWARNVCRTINVPPTLDQEGNVYIGCSDGTVAVFSAQGFLLWSTAITTPIGYPIALAQDRMYVISGGYLYAYNAEFSSGRPWLKNETLVIALSIGVPSLAVFILIICAALGTWCVRNRLYHNMMYVYTYEGDATDSNAGSKHVRASYKRRKKKRTTQRLIDYSDASEDEEAAESRPLTRTSSSQRSGGIGRPQVSFGLPADMTGMLPPDFVADSLMKRACTERWYIPYDELRMQNIIGQGATGTIYKATWKGSYVAVKTMTGGFIKLSDTASGEQEHSKHIEEFIKEVGFLSSLRHPNIVMFLGASVIRTGSLGCGIVMEFCPLGSLWDVVHDRTNIFTWDTIIKLARGVAAGMMYLHSLNILHRDLKSPNVLVAKDMTPRITDFGLSKFRPDNVDETLTYQIGSPFWMPPEMMTGDRYDEKADVYSYAIILYEILTRSQPFKDIPLYQIYRVVTTGERPQIPSWCPSAYRTLMQACWNPLSARRPTFEDIVERIQTTVSKQHPETNVVLPLPVDVAAERRASTSALLSNTPLTTAPPTY